ncbi:hypothetical protein EYC80_006783 [Monilinia laxa]|uniref:M serotype protein n=1 Tax=Monilinia laxa TaxID=61186 RepID=A0A5N6JZL1_MONLA|nr:hypothetical protein EYC80_006783 [Monilinia laxa]
MSAATKKPPVTLGAGRRTSSDASSTGIPSRTSTRSPTKESSPATTTNGTHARSRSIRSGTPLSARSAMQRPGASTSNLSSNSVPSVADDDARAENIALLDDLKERLRKTETISEQFQKQAQVLQSRLDEALQEQGKLEDRLHENEEKLETLQNEKRDALRQKREMESIYEAERSSMTKEREEMANREEEMQTIIQRLKDSLSQRSSSDEESRLSRRSNNSSPNVENGQFAPPSGLNRSDSRNNSKLLLQKDRLIESLRLELAESQIKLAEAENMGGGRMQEVEKLLLEARMTNARLMEDNESFQLLLQEKTLNGDFSKDHFEYMGGSSSNADALNALEGRSPGASLADELSELNDTENENDQYPLTLYINKIIERLLQHQDFEAILDSDFKTGDTKAPANKDKDLPPPPPKEQASGASILQRAKTVAMGSRKPRPQSVMPMSHSSLNQDPETAPSIPFGVGRSSSVRQGGRPKSEQYTGSGASIVNQMYRGGQTSPPLHAHGPQTPRTSQTFFGTGPMAGKPNSRHTSLGQVPTAGNFPGVRSETSSISGDSGEVSTPPSSNSPPRKETRKFAGNKPKPLQLVQDKEEEEKTKAKRASWMGWAFGGAAAQKKEDSAGAGQPTEDPIIE